MKTRLILFFMLGSLVGFAQTAQQRLEAFKARMATYKMSELTEQQQQDTLDAWKVLEADAIYEAAMAEKTARTSDSTAQVAAIRAYVIHLKALKFACDNSQADWRKAWNRPEIFGGSWQAKADAAWAASRGPDGHGLEDFINFCKQCNY